MTVAVPRRAGRRGGPTARARRATRRGAARGARGACGARGALGALGTPAPPHMGARAHAPLWAAPWQRRAPCGALTAGARGAAGIWTVGGGKFTRKSAAPKGAATHPSTPRRGRPPHRAGCRTDAAAAGAAPGWGRARGAPPHRGRVEGAPAAAGGLARCTARAPCWVHAPPRPRTPWARRRRWGVDCGRGRSAAAARRRRTLGALAGGGAAGACPRDGHPRRRVVRRGAPGGVERRRCVALPHSNPHSPLHTTAVCRAKKPRHHLRTPITPRPAPPPAAPPNPRPPCWRSVARPRRGGRPKPRGRARPRRRRRRRALPPARAPRGPARPAPPGRCARRRRRRPRAAHPRSRARRPRPAARARRPSPPPARGPCVSSSWAPAGARPQSSRTSGVGRAFGGLRVYRVRGLRPGQGRV
jgi:hypothetical protein